MAEIIRPFPPQPSALTQQIETKLNAYRLEIQQLTGLRKELSDKQNETQRALEKQKQVSAHLFNRLQRTEQQLKLEQERLGKTQGFIAGFQRQWTQVVENDKKLRSAVTAYAENFRKAETQRQELGKKLTSLQEEIRKSETTHAALENTHLTTQTALVAAEKTINENRHQLATLEQQLIQNREAKTTFEQALNTQRSKNMELRHENELVRRELEHERVLHHDQQFKLSEALKRLAEKETEAQGLLRMIEAAQEKNNTLSCLLEKTKKEQEGAERMCLQLMEERTQLVKRGDDAYAELETLRAQQNLSRIEREVLLEQRSLLEEMLKEVTSESSERNRLLESERNTLQAAFTESRLQAEKALTELENERLAHRQTGEKLRQADLFGQQLMADRESLVKRGHDAYEERDQAVVTAERMEQDLASFRESNQAIERERQQWLMHQSRLEAEVQFLNDELATANTTIRDLQERETRLRDELLDTSWMFKAPPTLSLELPPLILEAAETAAQENNHIAQENSRNEQLLEILKESQASYEEPAPVEFVRF